MNYKEKLSKKELERLEDEHDIKEASRALEEYENNPKTYSLKELMDELGI